MSDNYFSSETTSSLACGGGCFSLSLLPPAIALLAGVLLLIMFGKTTGLKDDSEPIKIDSSLSDTTILSPIFTQEVLYWEASIIQWAEEWNLDANLVATVMQIESCGDPAAVSRSGAMGLFQVMPYHFEHGENAYQPNTNAARGLAYLRLSLDKFDTNYELALAGYNGGISGATRPQSQWSNEMNRYVYWGRNIFMDTEKNNLNSPYLDEWLSSGGASLCRQAHQQLGFVD